MYSQKMTIYVVINEILHTIQVAGSCSWSLSRFLCGWIGYMCWYGLEWCILMVDCMANSGNGIRKMMMDARIGNGENIDMGKIIINMTSCWSPAILVVNGCHDREIFKVEVFIVKYSIVSKIRKSLVISVKYLK